MRTIPFTLLNRQSFLARRVFSAWWYKKYGNSHSIMLPMFSEEDLRSFLKDMKAETIPNDSNLLWEECVKIANKGLC